MTEKELQGAVVELAQLLGYKVAHFRPARVTRGGKETYETPFAADGKGYPDLTMVRGRRLIFAEMKAAKGRVSEAQDSWLDALARVADATHNVYCVVWKPEDWLDGTIERTLKGR